MLKTKIYIFHPYSKIGGADLSISRLINNLNHKKFDFTFISLGKPAIKHLLKKKINFINLNCNRTFQCIFKIRQIINDDSLINKNYKKVIFISNQNFANVVSIISLIKINYIKKILIDRNNPIELDIIKSYKNKIIKFLIKLTYPHADKVIGISKDLSKDLQKLSKTKVETIYNPSFDKSILKFKKIKKSKRLFNKKIILSVARFEKQKNHLMLLKAFKLASQKINAHLILIGYGSLHEQIKEFIKKENLSDRVSIVEKPSNIFGYYKIADLFVLTSYYEGFGNVLVEAAINKIPIISTNCKSGPKEILFNGKYGDLVKINDYKKLSLLICKNIEKKNKSKINLMHKSLKRFSIKNHINKYEKIFDEI